MAYDETAEPRSRFRGQYLSGTLITHFDPPYSLLLILRLGAEYLVVCYG